MTDDEDLSHLKEERGRIIENITSFTMNFDLFYLIVHLAVYRSVSWLGTDNFCLRSVHNNLVS